MAAIDPISITLPAGDVAGFGPSPQIVGWVFFPPNLDPGRPQILAVCLHGGGYSKTYFHADEPGFTGYSMARHFAERGIVTVAIDGLGTAD